MREPEFNNPRGVVRALSSIFHLSSLEPSVLFYDSACVVGAELYLTWFNTVAFVDHFHFIGHSLHDQCCQHVFNPNVQSPLLYSQPGTPENEFLWKSNMAEVTNSWFEGFSSHVKVSSLTWHDTWLNHMCLARNEMKLREMMRGPPAKLTNPTWYTGRNGTAM